MEEAGEWFHLGPAQKTVPLTGRKWNGECAFKEGCGHLKCPCRHLHRNRIREKSRLGMEIREQRERDGPGEEDFDEKSGDFGKHVSVHAPRQSLRSGSAYLFILLSLVFQAELLQLGS